MKIVSTNIAKPGTLQWKGREHRTGIYKEPQRDGVFLSARGVRGDTIGNPKVHGNRLKACYLFDAREYPYWKAIYPDLDWEYGIFGENLTMEGLDEGQLLIGSVFRIGEALLRITAPREPCFKLGIRFGDQQIIDRFVERQHPGAYAEVLEEGWASPGDIAELDQAPEASMTIREFHTLLYSGEKNPVQLRRALSLPVLSEGKRKTFRRWLRI